MVASSAMGLSELGFQAGQQLRVRFGVDFAFENLFRSSNRERGYLSTQGFLGTKNFLLDLCFCAGNDTLCFYFGGRLGFFHQNRAAFFCLRNDFARLRPRALQLFGRALGGKLQILLAALRRGQAFGDLLLSSLDGLHQRRPDELDSKPDEQRESDRLGEHGYTDIHGCLLKPVFAEIPAQRITASSGLPNANSIASPTPMMNDASIRPSSRNTLACNAKVFLLLGLIDASFIIGVGLAMQEYLGLQCRNHFRLAGRAFQEA